MGMSSNILLFSIVTHFIALWVMIDRCFMYIRYLRLFRRPFCDVETTITLLRRHIADMIVTSSLSLQTENNVAT